MNKTEKKKSEQLESHKIEEETLESVSGGAPSVDFEKYKDKYIGEKGTEQAEFGVGDAKKKKGPRLKL